MNKRYTVALVGALVSRLSDEMSGVVVLLVAYAVVSGSTGTSAVAGTVYGALTVASAVGGPLLGAALDRARRPGRVLAACLVAYAVGLIAVTVTVGARLVVVAVVLAFMAGLAGPAVTGGWSAFLGADGRPPRRVSDLDAVSYSVSALAGPALAGVLFAAVGGRIAVALTVALLVLGAVVAVALTGARQESSSQDERVRDRLAAGFAAIVTIVSLRRATVTTCLSFVGIGMFTVAAPVLGAQRLGGSSRGALLLSVLAAAALVATLLPVGRTLSWEVRLVASTLVAGVGLALCAVPTVWASFAGAAVIGIGDGPQLAAIIAIRHRDAPAAVRGQVFTTGASLKITAAGVGGLLAGQLLAVGTSVLLLVGAAVCVVSVLVGGCWRARVPVPA